MELLGSNGLCMPRRLLFQVVPEEGVDRRNCVLLQSLPTVFDRRNAVGNKFVAQQVLAKYDTYINVRVCSTVKSVMYPIQVRLRDTIVFDEPNSLLNTRYVSPRKDTITQSSFFGTN